MRDATSLELRTVKKKKLFFASSISRVPLFFKFLSIV